MDNPQRLNVAMTRALQAEIIVMNEKMTTRPSQGMRIKTTYTSKLWEDTLYAGRLFEFHENQVQSQQILNPRHTNVATASVREAPVLTSNSLG
jgi:rhamnogalacturonyl hydrolase YesR